MNHRNESAFYTQQAHYPNVAALDLGTNSCRLLIASVSIVSLYRNFFKIKSLGHSPLKIVDSFARVVGLGEGIKQTGVLSRAAMERTIEALAICQRKMKSYNVLHMRAVATEACRQAKNSHVLLERAKAELDLHVEVISPQEEALLVLKGCMGVLSDKFSYAIILDIGGGSTEIIWLRLRRKNQYEFDISVIDSMSLPYGVVTLRDTYIHGGHQTQIFMAAQQAISQAVGFFIKKNNIRQQLNCKRVQIVASSGTVTTLAFLSLGLPVYDRSKIDGVDFLSTDLQKTGNLILSQYLNQCDSCFSKEQEEIFLARINKGSSTKRTLKEPTAHARTGLLASGTAILNAITEGLGPHELRVADRGVREGLLAEIIEAFRSAMN